MEPVNIEVTNEDISKLAQDDERFRCLIQLTAATRTIDELTAKVAELTEQIAMQLPDRYGADRENCPD